MPKVGGRRKKARSQKQGEPNEQDNAPRAFVFKKGKCSETCKQLSIDFRKCFYPNTAMKLQASNKLAIKSYLKAAKYYSVTHLVAFQQSKQKTYARFIKVGGGEMLFRVLNYCRMKDVQAHGGESFSFSFKQPLIVLNNFTENNQVRQIGRSIQQMFPNINLDTINLKLVRRVLSFTYQANKKCIYFRHYKIIINEGGVNNSFKQLTKQVHSDMSQYKSFAQFLQNVKNGQNIQNKHTNENQRQVKLIQMGPRMKLKFVSFKEGFGRVQQDQQVQQQQNQNLQRQNNKSSNRNKNKNGNNRQEMQQNQQIEQLQQQQRMQNQ